MPTIVFQGLQSCVEPQIVETRSLNLKLSSPNPEPSSWNITQFLSNSPITLKQTEPSHFYSMTKNNSYSKLSNKSLELCTENLGCETGTDMIENTFFSLPSREPHGTEKNVKEQLKLRQCSEIRKKKSGNFPPPLTTMVGSNALQVRPIRERGRLVIQAVEAPSSHGCFQAERSNGRLRLSLLRDAENYETDNENESCKDEIKDMENEVNCEIEKNNFEEMDEAEAEDEDHGVKSEFFVLGDLEGNNREIGGEMGIIKFQRPIWCKEGGRCNKGLCNWEPFWVATS